MKLVAVSDTHGDAAILTSILRQQPDADAYFYAGDSELTADDPVFQTYRAVAGNMDFEPHFPLTLTQTVGGITVFMTHGHRFGVNFGLDELLAAGQAQHAALIIFGHTHQLGVEQHAGVLVLNPGSISQPRGEFAALGGTYATVAADARQWTVTFFTRDGQPVDNLTRTFPR